MNSIDFGFGTHSGLVREHNEDSYGCFPDIGLWVIADGMGGHAAGEVASDIAVQEIARRIGQGMSLTVSIEAAHRSIQTAALQGKGAAEMGSTVVALKLTDSNYEIAWVGDSRAYLWNGKLTQLTKDHSYVQQLLDAGLIAESEMHTHPCRNIISQALGTGGLDNKNITVDSVSGELDENQTVLLCSDGLSGVVSDEHIAAIVAEATNAKAKIDRLINTALEAGGHDNITVIVLSREP